MEVWLLLIPIWLFWRWKQKVREHRRKQSEHMPESYLRQHRLSTSKQGREGVRWTWPVDKMARGEKVSK